MSAQPQGPGWWQASDGNWYPPEGQAAAAPPPFPSAGVAVPPPPYPVSGYGQPLAATGAPLSSAGKRLGAYLLDIVLLVFTLFIGWLIWSMVIWSKGQSPAKALLGMRVIRTDTGRCATWGQMALRELVGKWLLGGITSGITSIISCFMILSASRQGIWDKIANTVVVDDPDGRLAPT